MGWLPAFANADQAVSRLPSVYSPVWLAMRRAPPVQNTEVLKERPLTYQWGGGGTVDVDIFVK